MSKLQRALIYSQKMIHLLEEKSLCENIMAVLGKYNALAIGLFWCQHCQEIRSVTLTK